MKGFLIVDKFPESCVGCMFNDMGFCQAIHEGGENIPDEDIDNKPGWCPVQEYKER